jgi:transcription antitermination factor NusG
MLQLEQTPVCNATWTRYKGHRHVTHLAIAILLMNSITALASPSTTDFQLTEEKGRELPYYALQVKHRFERPVEQGLRLRGLFPFLPMYITRNKWSDRVAEIQTPLFPGYVFCPMDIANRLPVVSTPGVISILGAGKHPLPIDPCEMAAVQMLAAQGLDVQPCWARPGQRVRVNAGPLRGVEGTVVQARGRSRLVVSISVLNRSISAVINTDQTVLF